jgi:SAM-dependent methyltransferase
MGREPQVNREHRPDKQFWNDIYVRSSVRVAAYDSWLDKYSGELEHTRTTPVLDLGCGAGNNTLYLSERGFPIIACDFSEEALRCVRTIVPAVDTLLLDLTEPLPFPDESAQLAIADLSLHYFPWEQTKQIVSEIRRVLKPRGVLLCRVNSTKDVEYGAGQGELLEPGYFLWEGQRKRFFDGATLEELFQDWRVSRMEEQVLHRYGKPKWVWELCAYTKK